MPDVHTPEQRRKNMQAIRDRDTCAELALRRELHRRGLVGYRCAPKQVVGKPDIAYTRWRVAVFVDGCFWHGCPECYVRPETNSQFWDDKLRKNADRDSAVNATLVDAGWIVLRFWEHDVHGCLGSVVAQVEQALCAAGRPVGIQ